MPSALVVDPSLRPRLEVAKKRVTRLMGALCCLWATTCGSDDTGQRVLGTPDWLVQAMALPVGRRYLPATEDDTARTSLHALGYARVDKGVYERRVDLTQAEPLVLSQMPQLPEIDTIAVVSVYRANLDEQYIYPTLRSLLAELPDTAQINVLVGNADTAYLQPQVLEAEVGAGASARVHLFVPPQPVDDFFAKERIATSPRAAWNYARALRGYVGHSNLLLLEDDVTLAKNGLRQLRPWLQDPRTPAVVALYNDKCFGSERLWARSDSALSMGPARIRNYRDYPTLQMLIYSKEVAAEAGSWLVLRAGRDPHDWMLGRYFTQEDPTLVGYVHPSLAQHHGLQTTGLSAPGWLPHSNCFAETIIEP